MCDIDATVYLGMIADWPAGQIDTSGCFPDTWHPIPYICLGYIFPRTLNLCPPALWAQETRKQSRSAYPAPTPSPARPDLDMFRDRTRAPLDCTGIRTRWGKLYQAVGEYTSLKLFLSTICLSRPSQTLQLHGPLFCEYNNET